MSVLGSVKSGTVNGSNSVSIGTASIYNTTGGNNSVAFGSPATFTSSGTSSSTYVINKNTEDCLKELNELVERKSWYTSNKKSEIFYHSYNDVVCKWDEVSHVGSKEQLIEIVSDILIRNKFKKIYFSDQDKYSYSNVTKKWVLIDTLPAGSLHASAIKKARTSPTIKAHSLLPGAMITTNSAGTTSTTNWQSVTIGKSLTIKDGDDQFTFKIKDKKLIVEQGNKEYSLILKNDEEVGVFTHIKNWFKSLKSAKV